MLGGIAIDARATSIDERAIAQAIVSERAGVISELLQKLGIDLSRFIEHILSSNAHALLELTPSLPAHPAADSPTVPPAVSMHNRRDLRDHEHHLATALAQVALPTGVTIRAWTAADFPAIQRISSSEGWTSPTQRPDESLLAWQNSWPALVAMGDEDIVGFVCGITDGAITMYITTLAVAAHLRGHGIGRALLDVCQALLSNNTA